jgi:hypothetical protein
MTGPRLKNTALLGWPAAVTVTSPEVVPVGTEATILVLLQLVGVAVTPLNCTVLVPCDKPKLVPVMVTEVPIFPAFGVKLLMAGSTTNETELPTLPAVTTTVAVAG